MQAQIDSGYPKERAGRPLRLPAQAIGKAIFVAGGGTTGGKQFSQRAGSGRRLVTDRRQFTNNFVLELVSRQVRHHFPG